jgi:thiamine biosynthesis lipoprotein
MGTQARVLTLGEVDLLDYAVARLHALESRWSRFRVDSEVTLVNNRAGEWVSVSEDTLTLFDRAADAQSLTEGLFDPLLLVQLAAAGYDRDLASLSRSRPAAAPNPIVGHHVGPSTIQTMGSPDSGREIGLDHQRQRVRIPERTGFDPGGIGKGLASDLVCGELLDRGAQGALVNIGGDVRVAGRPPSPDGWVIGVPDPVEPSRQIGRFSLADGAAATSSDLTRWWLGDDGERRHHILDPATGQPARSDVRSVTVAAAHAWQAEALATACFIAGVQRALRLVERHRAHAIVVEAEGGVVTTAGFDEVLW